MPIGSLRKPFTRIAFCSFGIGNKLICASSDPEGVGKFHWKIRNLKFTLAPLPSPGKRNPPGTPPPPKKEAGADREEYEFQSTSLFLNKLSL